jgi:hypothetical protein
MQNSHFNVLLTIEGYTFLTPSVASISAMHSFNDFLYSFEMTIAMAEWSTEVEKKALNKG